MVRSVLFDLGNVLMLFDPTRFWAALGVSDPERRAALTPHMLELGRIYESGAITTSEFRERFTDLFKGDFSYDELHQAFLSVLPEPIDGMESLVARVARTNETALVSNTNPIHFEMCLGSTPALKHLDRYYVSYELGTMKPSEGFYDGVIRGEGHPPSSMIFIDDLPANIAAAAQAGFDAILFTGAADLERQLTDRGAL